MAARRNDVSIVVSGEASKRRKKGGVSKISINGSISAKENQISVSSAISAKAPASLAWRKRWQRKAYQRKLGNNVAKSENINRRMRERRHGIEIIISGINQRNRISMAKAAASAKRHL